MKKLKGILFIGLCAILFISCEKNNDKTENGNGKTAKITFTVDGADPSEGDYVSLTVVGGKSGSSTKTFWQSNGVIKNNEEAVSLSKNDFTGTTKTYVIESVVPLDVIAVTVQCINFGSEYKMSYKVEINGKIENNDNEIIKVGKDYSHMFTY